ncbi:hypothetical protein [Sporosarcina sp. FSL K6-2383]|uniref:hypothetical protein n=1 Tax=Sporosarcina sp. FSL K6-2383 TaxID=2921556 RepID=UPI00315B2D41
MKKLLGTLVIILSFSLTTSTLASTLEVTDNLKDTKRQDEYKYTPPTKEQKEIELIVIEADMEARDEAYIELASMYRTLNGGYLEDTVEFKDTIQAKIDEKIEKYGIKRVSENESDLGISPMASPPVSEIAINKPVIYQSSQGYFIQGSATWKKDSWGEPYWLKHRPTFAAAAVGGDDGLGIYFSNSTNIDISTSSFYTADNYNKGYNSNLYPEKSQPQGVYYKAQDYIYGTIAYEYTWDKAYITVWPQFLGRVNTQARTHWTHTWSTAKITGVGITNSGFNVGISGISNSYDGASIQGVNIIY